MMLWDSDHDNLGASSNSSQAFLWIVGHFCPKPSLVVDQVASARSVGTTQPSKTERQDSYVACFSTLLGQWARDAQRSVQKSSGHHWIQRGQSRFQGRQGGRGRERERERERERGRQSERQREALGPWRVGLDVFHLCCSTQEGGHTCKHRKSATQEGPAQF